MAPYRKAIVALALTIPLALTGCLADGGVLPTFTVGAENLARSGLAEKCEAFRAKATEMDAGILAISTEGMTEEQKQDLQRNLNAFLEVSEAGTSRCEGIKSTIQPGFDAAFVDEKLIEIERIEGELFP